MKIWRSLWSFFCLPALILVTSKIFNVNEAVRQNGNSLEVFRGLSSQNVSNLNDLQSRIELSGFFSSDNCQRYWFRGLLYQKQGREKMRDRAWKRIFTSRCPFVIANFIQAIQPNHVGNARLAIRYFPEEARSWFWIGDLLYGRFGSSSEDQDCKRVAYYYQTGVEIEPTDGVHWLYLGHCLSKNENNLQLALEAYLKACRYNDPGHNGCLYAGKTAEKMGDFTAAIQYYRRSDWPEALQRADELEQLLPNSVINQP